ncbi:hypothetical protein FDECE_9828 [Fusarium decemcellulare]|nr:hypothetical protein FDECE_9828 [Fusarium decemcellulare]
MALSEKSLSAHIVDGKLPAMTPPEYENIGIQRGGTSNPWGVVPHALTSMLRPRGMKKAEVKVSVHGHFNSKIYTTNSDVSGEVIISPTRNMPFDHIEIALVGSGETRRDGPDITHMTTHRFLRLEMPINEDEYPDTRVFEAGKTYTFPFNFNVPAHLTSLACVHKVNSDDVWEKHMSLPPTIGGWEKDDLAPDMARISYGVKAHIMKRSKQGMVIMADSSQSINVIPAGLEDPPLNITKNDELYSLERSKNVRKNMFSASQGRISAVAAQPAAIYLTKGGYEATQSSIPVSLTFEPSAADVIPPQISSVSSKIQAYTWFRDAPMQSLPNFGKQSENFAYPASTSLPKAKTSVKWTQNVDLAQSNKDSPIFHTATVEVPFKLPIGDKMFIPTFHSCIISRVYAVKLVLEGDVKVDLAVPLQIVMGPEN